MLGNGHGLDGERRPANLEDVFVLLTGEEIVVNGRLERSRAERRARP